MQKFLIILRGAPASGKSSIAKRLRSYPDKIAWLKVDNFKPFFVENATLSEQKDVDELALSSLQNLLDKEFSVVMEKIFFDPFIIPLAVQEAEKRNIQVKVFQLECSLDTLIARDKSREGVKEGCRQLMEFETIAKIHKQLNETFYNGAINLNTDKYSLDECVEIIKNSLT